ncbi:uncharacterized protein LOC122263320 [Penaeus japonicus]|uniref:uncharacterized protein LOC122263320 n=1 Tax=Penaeus japonicus TaxID=27405 RepID=UPI001C7104F3|nr:uncharacterized protein LOC122263320 [Penaeus japonicus]XP_042887640.1 uncharacterized protein LOC122263320 [Penaeus japonicus]
MTTMNIWSRNLALATVIMLGITFMTVLHHNQLTALHMTRNSAANTSGRYDVWPSFSVEQKHDAAWYVKECFDGQQSEDIEVVTGHLLSVWSQSKNAECAELYLKCAYLYEVHDRYSSKMQIPGRFAEKLNQWLHNDAALVEKVHHQHLIHVFHPLTSEHTVYNPVRASRPMPTQEMDLFEWIEKLSADSKKNCDFCMYKKNTAVDRLGRDDESDTARVTNTFKVEAWHSMVVTKHLHHPLNFTRELMSHFFEAAMAWVYDVSEAESNYIYPNIAWDTLHHAGASQIHPHIHMMMAPDHYYGYFELLRSAAQRYYEDTGENYFNAVLEVHAALGLVVRYGRAVAIPTLTGKADLEVMFLSETPNEDFYHLIFHTISAYHDTFTQLCKGFAGAMPALGTSEEASRGRIPTIAKLISRGDCTSLRTDYSTFEIFQIVYRIYDPWRVAAAIRKAIKTYNDKY